jgi:hypothetical protein
MLCLVDIDTADREQAAREVCALAEVAIGNARREIRTGVVPFLYQSGVKYTEQRPEACCFRPPSEVLERKGGDCKQLTTWRIAELREANIDARPRVIWLEATDGKGVKGFIAHMLLRLPDTNLEDPSVNLGMSPP